MSQKYHVIHTFTHNSKFKTNVAFTSVAMGGKTVANVIFAFQQRGGEVYPCIYGLTCKVTRPEERDGVYPKILRLTCKVTRPDDRGMGGVPQHL